MDKTTEPTAHQEWQERLAAVAAEQEPGWEIRNGPGSFGCHELLDRVMLVGDLVAGQVLEHPACVLQEEWHRLAAQAVEALRELYQRVGAEHLALRMTAEPNAVPTQPAYSFVIRVFSRPSPDDYSYRQCTPLHPAQRKFHVAGPSLRQ